MMELVLEELSETGLAKVTRAFEDFITEVHIFNVSNTATVVLGHMESALIDIQPWGVVSIFEGKTQKHVSLSSKDYVRVVIQ